jgi:polyisoprenoid-binding protein YceI
MITKQERWDGCRKAAFSSKEKQATVTAGFFALLRMTTLTIQKPKGDRPMKTVYDIDPAHSSAQFTIRHLMISNVRGDFKSVKGTVVYDPANLADTSIEAEIDVNSLNTRDENRDAHVKSAEFFNAEKYPSITFKSSKVESAGDGELKISGGLTILGVTKEVVLKVEGPSDEAKDPWGNLRIGASASTRIKRSDFGLTWNAALETGGVVLGDDVKIELDLELVKQKSA